MKPTYEELVAEVERLRAKLSPLEDRSFTAEIKPLMNRTMLEDFRVGKKYQVRPGDLWDNLFGVPGNTRDLAKLGRSLQGMGWVRSAMRGNLVFTMTVEEFRNVEESAKGADL